MLDVGLDVKVVIDGGELHPWATGMVVVGWMSCLVGGEAGRSRRRGARWGVWKGGVAVAVFVGFAPGRT